MPTPASQTYNALLSDRSYWTARGRQAASLTIPYLMPSVDDPAPNSTPTLDLPWTGVGQQGVNNLANRLLMQLLPPTEPFFRLTIDEIQMAIETAGREDKDEVAREKAEYEAALNKLERATLRAIETSNDRPVVHELLLHLLVIGNVLAYRPRSGLRAFHLNRYVLKREPVGRPSLAVICEQMAVHSLPAKAKAIHEEQKGATPEGEDPKAVAGSDLAKVFTRIEWDYNDEMVRWHQEICDKQIPDTDGQSPLDESPWIPLRMYHLDGQDYSPGFVEAACIADLNTADVLSQAIVEGALVSARCIWGIKPNSQLTLDQFAKAKNGAAVTAMPDDVFAIQSNKAADLRVAAETEQRISARLSQAMMLQSFRDSERTTAQEVRLQALQLENGLGSIYSILTVEFQHPYVKRMLALMTDEGRLPKLPKNLVKPVVSVGLAAVGRGNDLERISGFVDLISKLLGPDAVPAFLKVPRLMRQLATASNLPNLDAVKTEDEVAKEQEQQQKAAAEQQQQLALLQSAAADPAKQAQAAATFQQMAQPPEGQQPPDAPAP